MEEMAEVGTVDRKIAITGNRNLTESDKAIIVGTMLAFVFDTAVKEIYFGGARGADTEALKAALSAHAACNKDCSLDLIVVLPDTLDKQPFNTRDITLQADKIVELQNRITFEDGWAAYHTRNRYMVDNATEVVAFWNGDNNSGTWSTIKYARAMNKPVTIVTITGSDK